MISKTPQLLIEAEKKFKKIWDVLRDKQVMHFTLSMRICRKGASKPKIISMQAEQSADGTWKPRFVRNQNSSVIQSRETLGDKLASIEKQVHVYVVKNALETRWKELKASLKDALKSGATVEDLEYQSEVPVDAVIAISYEAHFCAPIMATAYAIEGAEALANGDLNRASYCIEGGLYWSHADKFIPNPKDRFTKRASEGGKATAKAKAIDHEPVKEKVAELLITLAPQEGWKSTEKAIEKVGGDLTEKHHTLVKSCGLSYANLSKAIREWIRKEPAKFPHLIKSKA